MHSTILHNHILYVEDDESIRTIGEIAMADIGDFKLTTCQSGHEALEAVKGFTPDLFLLDVMMPEMDGIMTLAELRKQPRLDTVPVIFMTARVQDCELIEYQKLGAIDVIIKPFDPMTIAARIKHLLQDYYGP